MKLKIFAALIVVYILSSCASIPKETVELSKVLGNDLKVLHNSHKTMVELFYLKIADDINVFIDDVYSPYIIHYVLKDELQKYNNQEQSIYGTIEAAGKIRGKSEADDALNIMTEFLDDANNQVEQKRKELLNPIIKQKNDLINNINNSYGNAIYANTTITGYLESIRKVKESQQEALALMGLEGKDEELNNILLQASEMVKSAITKGKKIDIKSDEAFSQIEEISNQIKSISSKN